MTIPIANCACGATPEEFSIVGESELLTIECPNGSCQFKMTRIGISQDTEWNDLISAWNAATIILKKCKDNPGYAWEESAKQDEVDRYSIVMKRAPNSAVTPGLPKTLNKDAKPKYKYINRSWVCHLVECQQRAYLSGITQIDEMSTQRGLCAICNRRGIMTLFAERVPLPQRHLAVELRNLNDTEPMRDVGMEHYRTPLRKAADILENIPQHLKDHDKRITVLEKQIKTLMIDRNTELHNSSE